MKLAAFDVATRTGWAVCEPSFGIPKMVTGHWDLPKKLTFFEQSQELALKIRKFLKYHEVTSAAVEIPFFMPPRYKMVPSKDMAGGEVPKAQGDIRTQLRLWALHGAFGAAFMLAGVSCFPVGVKAWRAAILGNGNMKSAEAKAKAKKVLDQMNIHYENEDQAEAGCILLWLNGNYKHLEIEDNLRRGTPRSAA